MTLHGRHPAGRCRTGSPRRPTCKAAIRQIKAALRARIEASGRTVEEVFAVVEERVAAQVAEIAAAKERGETVWPVIDYADIEAGTVSAEALEKLRHRGCLVVRGHFAREQALDWDRGIVDYVESNRLLRELPRPWRRLLRQRRLQARDLPDLLVTGADAGPSERPDGARAGVPEQPVDAASPTACSGSTPTATRSTPTGSAAAPRAPTRPVWAPTSTPAPSTCG